MLRFKILMITITAACGSEPRARVTDGNLSGHHLRITSVNEPRYFDMLDPLSGALLPVSEWSGLFPEMIEWIATQAGFSYTLLTASGNGSSCHPLGSAAAASTYASQYGCAQDDVTELGLTDVYAGAFYVTQSRLRAGFMTTPYDCKSGLAAFHPGAPTTIPEYVELQRSGEKGAACTALGSAYSEWLTFNLPALQQRLSVQAEWVDLVKSGECGAFIVDKPIGDIISSSVCDLELTSGEVSWADPDPRATESAARPLLIHTSGHDSHLPF